MHYQVRQCTLCSKDLNEGDQIWFLTGRDANGENQNPCCNSCWGTGDKYLVED